MVIGRLYSIGLTVRAGAIQSGSFGSIERFFVVMTYVAIPDSLALVSFGIRDLLRKISDAEIQQPVWKYQLALSYRMLIILTKPI